MSNALGDFYYNYCQPALTTAGYYGNQAVERVKQVDVKGAVSATTDALTTTAYKVADVFTSAAQASSKVLALAKNMLTEEDEKETEGQDGEWVVVSDNTAGESTLRRRISAQ